MVIDRRRFLLGTASALCAMPSHAAWAAGQSAATPAHRYISAGRQADGGYAIAVLGEDGRIAFSLPIEGRGHDIAIAPDGMTAVVFARRPGRFAHVVDCARGVLTTTIHAADGRHFYGHGFFSPDGRLLYATENAYDDEEGVIGIYDVAGGYQRVGELLSNGIGPHDVALMPDGRTLVIANGGILTHPDFGRQKLNLSTMEPSLSYVDRETGALLEQVGLPQELHQISIRHLTVDGTGTVWFGGQYEGAPTDEVPLVGTHRPGEALTLFDAVPDTTRKFRNYIGSVVTNRSGSRVATTSPRGGTVAIWDVATRAPVTILSMTDVCGVAPEGAEAFLATSGEGAIRDMAHDETRQTAFSWDNHLRSL